MVNTGFKKATRFDLNSPTDLKVDVEFIKQSLAEHSGMFVLEFKISYKFFALYHLILDVVGKEKIKLIVSKEYASKYVEDIKIFESHYQKIEISTQTPTFAYYTKNDIIFNKKTYQKSFFSHLYNTEVFHLYSFKEPLCFTDKNELFVNEQQKMFDILLKNLQNENVSVNETQKMKKLLNERFLNSNMLSEKELNDFFEYVEIKKG